MADKTEMLKVLIESKTALDEAYRQNILDLSNDSDTPEYVIEMLQKERDNVLTEMSKRIDALKLEIAN